MKRIVMFTGKGGVGKSSIAAAHARKASLEGIHTLLLSTDMAHSLSDVLVCRIGREITQVAPGLDALEIDPEYEMNTHYRNIITAVQTMLAGTENMAESVDDFTSFPGLEELFSLLKILEIYEKGNYDLIIVDCAPTGETLALLKFPELLSWYIEKFMPIGKVALKILRPISRKVFRTELPDSQAVSEVEELYVLLSRLSSLLKNRAVTSIRLVTIPEKMVVEETKRNYMYLNLYNYQVDGLCINRILPEEMHEDFFTEWMEIQAKYLGELQHTFRHLPQYRVRWYNSDLNGLAALDQVAVDSLASSKVFDNQESISNEIYVKTEEGYELQVLIPCACKEDLMVHTAGTDLVIRIGNFKRIIPLPAVLTHTEVRYARFTEQKLCVGFQL